MPLIVRSSVGRLACHVRSSGLVLGLRNGVLRSALSTVQLQQPSDALPPILFTRQKLLDSVRSCENEDMLRHLLRSLELSQFDPTFVVKDSRGLKGVILSDALLSAAEFGNHAAVRILLKHGANPSFYRSYSPGDSVLFKAIRMRDAKTVSALIENNAKVTAVNFLGETPLSLARATGDPSILSVVAAAEKEATKDFPPRHLHFLFKGMQKLRMIPTSHANATVHVDDRIVGWLQHRQYVPGLPNQRSDSPQRPRSPSSPFRTSGNAFPTPSAPGTNKRVSKPSTASTPSATTANKNNKAAKPKQPSPPVSNQRPSQATAQRPASSPASALAGKKTVTPALKVKSSLLEMGAVKPYMSIFSEHVTNQVTPSLTAMSLVGVLGHWEKDLPKATASTESTKSEDSSESERVATGASGKEALSQIPVKLLPLFSPLRSHPWSGPRSTEVAISVVFHPTCNNLHALSRKHHLQPGMAVKVEGDVTHVAHTGLQTALTITAHDVIVFKRNSMVDPINGQALAMCNVANIGRPRGVRPLSSQRQSRTFWVVNSSSSVGVFLHTMQELLNHLSRLRVSSNTIVHPWTIGVDMSEASAAAAAASSSSSSASQEVAPSNKVEFMAFNLRYGCFVLDLRDLHGSKPRPPWLELVLTTINRVFCHPRVVKVLYGLNDREEELRQVLGVKMFNRCIDLKAVMDEAYAGEDGKKKEVPPALAQVVEMTTHTHVGPIEASGMTYAQLSVAVMRSAAQVQLYDMLGDELEKVAKTNDKLKKLIAVSTP